MGSMWQLHGVYVTVMGSMWLIRGLCGRYGVYSPAQLCENRSCVAQIRGLYVAGVTVDHMKNSNCRGAMHWPVTEPLP